LAGLVVMDFSRSARARHAVTGLALARYAVALRALRRRP
jgi:hypothetical protein